MLLTAYTTSGHEYIPTSINRDCLYSLLT